MNFLKKIRLLEVLIISSLFSFILSIFRVWYSGSEFYLFLNWNLFLAWVPLLLSLYLTKIKNNQKKLDYISISLIGLWLLFFPNSPYIITDFLHLREIHNIPLWYDVILITTFAWNGLVVGLISLHQIQTFLKKIWGNTKSWIFAYFCIILSSFGIYLGRFLRWNSWDIVKDPDGLFFDITDQFFNPRTIGVTLLFSTFLFLAYSTLILFKNSKNNI